MIDALNYIRLGHCDVVVTGGSEAAVTIAGMGGFNAMHALSTRNESPETASRPFDATQRWFCFRVKELELLFLKIMNMLKLEAQKFMQKFLEEDYLLMRII